MKSILNYFSGAVHEIRNVAWPTEKEAARLTRITIIFVLFFTVLFFFSDTTLGNVFTWIYKFFG